MSYLLLATWLNIALCTTVVSPTIAVAEDSRIVIKDAGNSYELTVPVSRLILSVPKGALTIGSNKHGGGTESPRYFFLNDAAEGVIISGWFEPAARYSDLGDSWRQEMEHMKKQGLPSPENVERSEIGTWLAILYNFPLPKGTSAHVRASYVAAGTWIDLHASISSTRPGSELRKQVEAIVRSIQIRQKQ